MLALTTVLTLTLSAPTPSDPKAISRHYIEQLAAGQFATAGAAFTDQMKGSLPPDKLALLWNGLQNQKGAFQKIERVSAEQAGDGNAEFLTCRFARGAVTFEVYVDGQGHIGGFFLTPASLVAKRFVNLLAKSDFTGAEEMFDATMRQALPAPKLTALWQDLVAEAGKFQELERTKVQPVEGNWAAIATAGFEKKSITLRVVVDGEAHIIGFFRQ
jgi:hypothetical protein